MRSGADFGLETFGGTSAVSFTFLPPDPFIFLIFSNLPTTFLVFFLPPFLTFEFFFVFFFFSSVFDLSFFFVFLPVVLTVLSISGSTSMSSTSPFSCVFPLPRPFPPRPRPPPRPPRPRAAGRFIISWSLRVTTWNGQWIQLGNLSSFPPKAGMLGLTYHRGL